MANRLMVNLVVWKRTSGYTYHLTQCGLEDWRDNQSAKFTSEKDARDFAGTMNWAVAQTLICDTRGALACPEDVMQKHGVSKFEALLGGGIAVREGRQWFGYKLNWRREYEQFSVERKLDHLEAACCGR